MPRFLALVTIAIAIVSLNHASPVDSHEVDRAALLSFKSGVWGNLSDWNSLRSTCNWTGVECDSRGRVIHLLLSHSNLTGAISPAIGNLSALERLELDNNQLSGSLPPELGKLSALLELNLYNNFLEGPILRTLGLLRSLTYLSLESNNLRGDIPEEALCNCSSLTYIGLSSNSLTGAIPFTAHCRLPGLRKLVFYENKLVGGIPPSIINFTGLEWVLLHDNSLSGVLPSQMFSKMPNLTYLYLSYNNFSSDGGNTNLDPFFASLVNCTSLQELGVASNGIGGKIAPIIGNLSANLSKLFLNDNRITGTIPRTIGNLPKLTVLSLSNNMLEGPIPSEISRPRLLGRLELSGNRINGEIPESIGVARHLIVIDISYNRLQGAIPETLSNLSRELESLSLHHNQLSGAIPSGLGCSMSLDLSYNKLTGQIPAKIAGLGISLQIYLNLSNNLLDGPLPVQIGSMESVQALDLSANKLSGTIPAEIRGCAALEYVNLSRNLLRGSLPSSIGALPNLQVLDVSFNGLAGVLPQSMRAATALWYANFSYNNFSGEVSKDGVFAKLSGDSFLGNPDLCGSISGMAPCETGSARRHVRRLVVIVIAVAVAVLAGLLALVCVVDHGLMKTRLRLIAPSPGGKLSRFPTGSVNGMGEMESEHPRISYRYRELVDATDGFSEVNLIGKGGYGRVYKGVLREGTAVAVKILHQDHAGEAIAGSFERECRVLRSIRHRNLIRVVTACSTPDFKALVLPFMPNGNLERLVHGPTGPGGGNKPAARWRLDLNLLLGIASDVAEGVAYLHHHAPVKVVHCDLKPSNVLLDGDMTAIVSDFGISKLVKDARDPETGGASTPSTCSSSITRLLQGSVGYIAPEYGLGGRPSTRGDVYSFGVMLLEMISGKRPTDVISEEGHGLHEWARIRCLQRHDVDAVVERSPLRGDPVPQHDEVTEVILELLELGVACTHLAPTMRPSMDDVAHEIACLRDGTWRKYRPHGFGTPSQPKYESTLLDNEI